MKAEATRSIGGFSSNSEPARAVEIPKRVSAIAIVVLLTGCTTSSADVHPVATAHGATLSLVSFTKKGATLELENVSKAPIAYDHWMSQGPEPVSHCRDAGGRIRICSTRVILTHEDEPYVHETYLEPGESVKLHALPGTDEQVGVHLWRSGRGEYLWLERWKPH